MAGNKVAFSAQEVCLLTQMHRILHKFRSLVAMDRCFYTARSSRKSWQLTTVMGHSANIKLWKREGSEQSHHSSSVMAAELVGRSTRNAIVCLGIRKRKQ